MSEKFTFDLNMTRMTECFTWRSSQIFMIHRSVLLRMRNAAEKICREKHILSLLNFFFRKSCRLWYNVQKYGTAKQTTWQYNTAHALCMLDKKDYRHALRICNTYSFPQQNWFHERTSIFIYKLPVMLFPVFIVSFFLPPSLPSNYPWFFPPICPSVLSPLVPVCRIFHSQLRPHPNATQTTSLLRTKLFQNGFNL